MMRICVAILLVNLFETLIFVKGFVIHCSHPRTSPLFSQVAPSTTGVSMDSTAQVTSTAKDHGVDISKQTSPYGALDYFLSIVSEHNLNQEGSVKIVSRGSSKLPPHQVIESFVLTTTEGEDGYVVAVVAAGLVAHPFKVEAALSKKVNFVPADHVQSICGFPPGTIPPLGHYAKGSTPKATAVSILLDKDLLDKCQSENLMLLGGGGHAYWQSLMSPETLLALPNIQVSQISSEDGEATTQTTTKSLLWASSSDDLVSPKDFSTLQPPSMHIAELVIKQRDLSNPLTPSLVTMVGRLGKVLVMGKRMVNCEFLPLDTKETQEGHEQISQPWKSSNGISMALQLVAGKPLLQQLGSKHGEIAIQNLKEGMEIQVQAKTNVGSRQSLEVWVENRTLDLLVLDYQVLANGVVTDTDISTSLEKPYKNKPKAPDFSSFLQSLTLKDVFNGTTEPSIELVDNMNSIQSFVEDYKQLVSWLEDNRSRTMDPESLQNPTPPVTMVGIDCEWRPRQFLQEGEPQPILLLQVSLHQLQKIYVFDFQTLLRPLLPLDESLNELETALFDVFGSLFVSKNIIKTGYQLPSDLRLIAASYPHMSCFQEVQSVLETSTLIKRILHVSKQKKVRGITVSLARMTSHYLGKTVDKKQQVSNWAERPMTSQQLDYASLDAAISPVLAEKALESIDARINMGENRPLIERFQGDKGLLKEIVTWRFSVLQNENSEDMSNPQAKRTMGSSWIISQNWVTGNNPPQNP